MISSEIWKQNHFSGLNMSLLGSASAKNLHSIRNAEKSKSSVTSGLYLLVFEIVNSTVIIYKMMNIYKFTF